MQKFGNFDSIIKATLEASVPPGDYGLDCFVTSEVAHNEVINRLSPGQDGGIEAAYLGVGPCQNYTYIGVFNPDAAIIADARVDNVLEHLLFKGLFERAASPAEYLCLLLSRASLHPRDYHCDNPSRFLAELESVPFSREAFDRTWNGLSSEMERRWAIRQPLLTRAGAIFHEFGRRGLRITSVPEEALPHLDYVPTLGEVLTATASNGRNYHYLTDPVRFGRVKTLHSLDRIIPILGNLTEVSTARRVNDLLGDLSTSLKVIYLSNLEEFMLHRYVFSGTALTARPNPRGVLAGDPLTSYRRLLSVLGKLRCDKDCVLIRFFWPEAYRGWQAGARWSLEPHITFLDSFRELFRGRTPGTILETYF